MRNYGILIKNAGGTAVENRNSYQENIKNASIKPLDNDGLTRFAYLHDDDITRLFEKLHALERRVSELEEKNKK